MPDGDGWDPDDKILGVSDHTVSQSIYIADPDGNAIELYVDTSDVWRTDPQAVAVKTASARATSREAGSPFPSVMVPRNGQYRL